MADVHIQTEPVCNSKSADLLAGPASRKIKSSKTSVREKLCLPSNHKWVLITTGGIPQEYKFINELYDQQDIHFVIPGGSPAAEINQNLILLPHHSDFFHPDLVNASDAVIGKAGYSTIAEIYNTGVPFGYIPATDNPESEKLVEFIQSEMTGSEISESEFQAGNWVNGLNDLVNMPRIDRNVPNGADQIAEFVLTLLT
jgi:UDP-N-acetylglucosamine:LPS N-acetylglucosamine transferase